MSKNVRTIFAVFKVLKCIEFRPTWQDLILCNSCGSQGNDTLVDSEAEESDSPDSSPEPEVQRSSRQRIPTTKFSYDTVGGNPTRAALNR